MNDKPKSFLKKYWLIIVLIFIAIIVTSITVIDHNKDIKEREKQEQKKKEQNQYSEEELLEQKNIHEGRKPPMTKEELAKANNALQAGIFIEDEENDFIDLPEGLQGDGKPDSQDPLPLPFADIKSVRIGADETYIYLKYEFYGAFPDELQAFGDDYIAGVSCNFGLHDYYNHTTKKVDGSGLFQVGITYAARNKDQLKLDDNSYFFNPPKLATSTFGEANSAVKDENGEDTYGIATDVGKTYGGSGYDYIIAAFPLSNLGLLTGDTITFEISAESGSKIYHHQSVDPILYYGSEKSGKNITWVIGSNTYEVSIPKY